MVIWFNLINSIFLVTGGAGFIAQTCEAILAMG